MLLQRYLLKMVFWLRSMGLIYTSQQEIVSFHQPLFDTWLKRTRLIGEVTRVQFLTADVAVMHAIGGTIMRGKSKPYREILFRRSLPSEKMANGSWLPFKIPVFDR